MRKYRHSLNRSGRRSMKKFSFTLDSLFELKKAQKDQRQKEFAEAKARLEKAMHEKDSLEKTYTDENEKYEKKVNKGVTAGDIEFYAIYFKDLRGKIAAAACEIARAQEEAGAKQEALVEAFKEIKSLEKLRDKQYEEYLTEEAKQESKLREDILAFDLSGKKAKLTVS